MSDPTPHPPTAPEPDAPVAPVIPDVLPLLPLRDSVIFPYVVAPVGSGEDRTVRLVDDAMRTNRLVALVASRDREVEAPGPDDVYGVGIAATILQLGRMGDGVRLVVQGVERITIHEVISTEPYLLARVGARPDRTVPDAELDGLRRAIIDLLRTFQPLTPGLPAEIIAVAESLEGPREVGYLTASVLPIGVADRQAILERDPLDAKLRLIIERLQSEISVRELGRSIASRTEERLTKAQREHILREQLRSIQAELGEGGAGSELDALRTRVQAANLPPEPAREVQRELDRLSAIPEASPEFGLVRTWLEWMADLPWTNLSGAAIDVGHARSVLDEDHYDLEEIKDRILEYLAVRRLRNDRGAADGLGGGVVNGAASEPAEGTDGGDAGTDGGAGSPPTTPDDEHAREPILCFVGPPGVGKTSLGQSIARALGRKFVRMSLGGVRDEAEIRGHRRTYIGALPGRIVQGIRRVETRDPVFMLDEIDKVGSDWRGDPTSALLEVLDPAQNDSFTDTYLGVPFDLSQVLFVTTANTLETIPGPLLDRMEILRIAGYTVEEKLGIARRYLVPQQLRAHGLRQSELAFSDETLRQIIRGYTREAGVRDLDRRIAAACRKVARRIAERTDSDGASQDPPGPITVEPSDLADYLGRQRHYDETAERTTLPGVATGLAWTPVGGEVLFVEAAALPDPGEPWLILTGMLGDVMRESAQAALTYVISGSARLGIEPRFFSGKRVHVHVPAGALPKDGPSAGVAIATAICSLALGRPVRDHVAMTGEITLRGKVLPVGGIKEKVLAAHSAGVTTVILPRRNEPDLDDIPDPLRGEIRFVLADMADEVFAEALGIRVAAETSHARGPADASMKELPAAS